MGQLKLSVLLPFIIGKTWVMIYRLLLYMFKLDNVHDLCSWIIKNQWIFLGWIGYVKYNTARYCINFGSQNSSCLWSSREFKNVKTLKCYCDEDLCNTGNLDRELSYLLMGITIGFQIVINCHVVWKYIAMSKTWF